VSKNQQTSTILPELSNCTSLMRIEVDNNLLSEEIRLDLPRLHNLTLFYVWKNRLTGGVPANLAECLSMQAMDLSYNSLTGPIEGPIRASEPDKVAVAEQRAVQSHPAGDWKLYRSVPTPFQRQHVV
jgi:hypothetical protein